MTDIEQSYESKLDAAEPRLYARLVFLAIGLFVTGTNGFVIAGLLPQIGQSFSVPPKDVSYSITFYALSVAVLAPVISITLARVSRTTLMAAGMVLVGGGTILAAISPNLTLFIVARVIAGVGAAAFVPTATASAALMAPPERRGSAIAFVTIGFTAATAFGAPLGTAIAAISNWRVPMFGLAAIALLNVVAVAFLVRKVPHGSTVSVAQRFAILGNGRILVALLATLVSVCGFNLVYIFSSAITAPATNGSQSLLALLLLLYGVSGIPGTLISGRLTDRFGNRRVGTITFAIIVLLLAAIPLVVHNFVLTAILFVVWGVVGTAGSTPIQHRLVEINPAASAISLSWSSTALYAGIGLAPLLGAEVLGFGNPELLPLIGAAITALALVAFLLGWAGKRRTSRVAEVPA